MAKWPTGGSGQVWGYSRLGDCCSLCSIPREGIDFPATGVYEKKTLRGGGKIPGSFSTPGRGPTEYYYSRRDDHDERLAYWRV